MQQTTKNTGKKRLMPTAKRLYTSDERWRKSVDIGMIGLVILVMLSMSANTSNRSSRQTPQTTYNPPAQQPSLQTAQPTQPHTVTPSQLPKNLPGNTVIMGDLKIKPSTKAGDDGVMEETTEESENKRSFDIDESGGSTIKPSQSLDE